MRRTLVAETITKLAVGGAQLTVLELCRGVNRDLFEVVVLAGVEADEEGTLAPEFRAAGIDCIDIPSLRRGINPLKDIQAGIDLFRRFRTLRPAVVHTHSSKAGAIGRVAARLARVPVVVHTVHGWSFRLDGGSLSDRAAVIVERLLARLTTAIIVVSDVDRSAGLSHRIGAPGQYHLIRSGVQLDRFMEVASERAATEGHSASRAPVVGYVGRLAPQKDPATLIRAIALLRDRGVEARLEIVGDGVLRPDLEGLVESLGLQDRVTFLGVRRDVSVLMAGFDVFALPSLWEGLPRTLIEAIAAGVPVVATAVNGVPEVVVDGETGLLVQARDIFGMARALQEVAERPDLAAARAAAGSLRIGAFGSERMVSDVESLYARLAGTERRIRLAHVTTGLERGGAETVLYRLTKNLDPSEFEIIVISLTGSGPMAAQLESLGIPVLALDLRGWRFPLSFLALVCALRRFRADVVQTWLYHGDVVGGLAARLSGTPEVVWGVHQLYAGAAAPRSTTRKVARVAAALSSWLPNATIYCSDRAQTSHLRAGYRSEHSVVIGNGIDVREFRPRPTERQQVRSVLALSEDTNVVGTVGRIVPAKDHQLLLRAMAIVMESTADVALVIAGEGADHAVQLRKQAEELGLSEICRWSTCQEIPLVMNAFDLFVLSSVEEGFGNVIGEAMACGIPCVSTNTGAAKVLIETTGLVVPVGDAVALAAAISRLLSLSQEDRNAMGVAARRRITEHFTVEAMAERYADLYRTRVNHR